MAEAMLRLFIAKYYSTICCVNTCDHLKDFKNCVIPKGGISCSYIAENVDGKLWAEKCGGQDEHFCPCPLIAGTRLKIDT